MNKITVELKNSIPVWQKGKEDPFMVSSLSLGRMKAKHLKLLPKNFSKNNGKEIDASELLPLIAGLADMELKSIEELDMEDLQNVSEKVAEVMGESVSLETTTNVSG